MQHINVVILVVEVKKKADRNVAPLIIVGCPVVKTQRQAVHHIARYTNVVKATAQTKEKMVYIAVLIHVRQMVAPVRQTDIAVIINAGNAVPKD